jgi:N-methylhydantoinase B
MEKYYPLVIEEYRTRCDSCGAGQFRGGCGVRRTYRFLADGRITYQDDRAQTYPYGVDGGRPGAASRKTLIRKNGEEVPMPSKVRDVPVFEGDRLVFETAGAGGLGDPLERPPEAVAKDVRWNLVSRESAESEYGVVIGDDGGVDEPATSSKRENLRSSRGELPQFDPGDVPDRDELSRRIATERRDFDEWLSKELG